MSMECKDDSQVFHKFKVYLERIVQNLLWWWWRWRSRWSGVYLWGMYIVLYSHDAEPMNRELNILTVHCT